MKPLFYVILSRPKECKTWLQHSGKKWKAGNFFTSIKNAEIAVAGLYSDEEQTYLHGLKKWVPWEYRIGAVCALGDNNET